MPGWRQVVQGIAAVFLLATAAGAQAQGKVHTVVIEALKFTPPVLEIKAGDMVVWENRDPYPHTVTALRGGFESGEIAPKGSWKFNARDSGEFPYRCRLHPTMKASLIVR